MQICCYISWLWYVCLCGLMETRYFCFSWIRVWHLSPCLLLLLPQHDYHLATIKCSSRLHLIPCQITWIETNSHFFFILLSLHPNFHEFLSIHFNSSKYFVALPFCFVLRPWIDVSYCLIWCLLEFWTIKIIPVLISVWAEGLN